MNHFKSILTFCFIIIINLNINPQKTITEKLPVFTETELKNIIANATQTNSSNKNQQALQIAATEMAKKLSSYNVTGVSFCVDPNFSFFFDNQNPEFDVTFKDNNGNIKVRHYQASINSIGFKIALSVNFNFIFFVNTDLNFLNSNEKLELGIGIDISIPFASHKKEYINLPFEEQMIQIFKNSIHPCLTITYAPIKNHKGGILIMGISPIFTSTGLNIVIGGNIKPKK